MEAQPTRSPAPETSGSWCKTNCSARTTPSSCSTPLSIAPAPTLHQGRRQYSTTAGPSVRSFPTALPCTQTAGMGRPTVRACFVRPVHKSRHCLLVPRCKKRSANAPLEAEGLPSAGRGIETRNSRSAIASITRSRTQRDRGQSSKVTVSLASVGGCPARVRHTSRYRSICACSVPGCSNTPGSKWATPERNVAPASAANRRVAFASKASKPLSTKACPWCRAPACSISS